MKSASGIGTVSLYFYRHFRESGNPEASDGTAALDPRLRGMTKERLRSIAPSPGEISLAASRQQIRASWRTAEPTGVAMPATLTLA
jgi:hypothetical protein